MFLSNARARADVYMAIFFGLRTRRVRCLVGDADMAFLCGMVLWFKGGHICFLFLMGRKRERRKGRGLIGEGCLVRGRVVFRGFTFL